MISISKRRLAGLATASAMVATLAVASVPAAAMAAGPAPKATGDVYADRTAEGLGTAHMVFVAQATSPAKGTFTYSDDKGSYTINVQDVKLYSATVVKFAGPVVTSNYPGIGGTNFVGIAVRDGGEPGIGVDRINGQVYPSLQAAIDGYSALSPDNLTASAGNVQVNVRVCTFSATNSNYYSGYASGSLTFSWLQETGEVLSGHWEETVGNTHYPVDIASGTVVNGTVNMMTAERTLATPHSPFNIDGTLSNGEFVGVADGGAPYTLLASGTTTCSVPRS